MNDIARFYTMRAFMWSDSFTYSSCLYLSSHVLEASPHGKQVSTSAKWKEVIPPMGPEGRKNNRWGNLSKLTHFWIPMIWGGYQGGQPVHFLNDGGQGAWDCLINERAPLSIHK